MKRISLLYTKSGGGHVSLSNATKEALDRFCKGKYTCQMYDPFPNFYSNVYKQLSTQLQTVWKLGYQATDIAIVSQTISYLNRLPIANHLLEHIQSFQPDIVISNNAFISTVLPTILNKFPHPPKRVVHFADPYSLHRLWLSDQNADLYLSPTPEITAKAIQSGIEAKNIKTVGWLTRQAFLEYNSPPEKIRPILGLDPNKFTIFIGGAGQGVEKTNSLLKLLAESPTINKNCQIIVNTGLNSQIASKVLRLAEKHNQLIHVVPFAHNMSYLLSASDISVGKAGPNFVFESVHRLRPIVAISCIPGQEEGNLEFIKKSNLGWIQEDLGSAVSLLEQLSQNQKLIAEKLPFLKKIHSKHANTARNLATEISRLK